MKKTELQLLTEALRHLDQAIKYSHFDLEEDLVVDAIAMRLVACLDALGQLDEGRLNAVFGGGWHLMRGMRNRLVHGYATFDADFIRHTVRVELTPLRGQLSGEITKFGGKE